MGLKGSVVIVAAALAALVSSASSRAAIVYYNNVTAWQGAVGPPTVLDFVFTKPQFLADQYESLGVLFPEGNDGAIFCGAPPGDGWCLAGEIGDGQSTLQFLAPQKAIAASLFAPGLRFNLYSGDTLFFTSPRLGLQPFVGLVSDTPFDRVVFTSAKGSVFVNDVLFSSVPAPPVFAALLGALAPSRRRRR